MNAWDTWDATFGGTEAVGPNYIQPAVAVAGGQKSFLLSQTTFTPGRTLSLDWSIDFIGSTDAGVYFMAATNNLAINSYRIRMNGNFVEIAQLNGAGAVLWSDTWAYAPAASGNVNYFRIHFYPQNYEFGDGDILASCGGAFLVYAGTALKNMVQLVATGTGIDGAPRTTGNFFGIYTGSNSQPKVSSYVIGDDFYALKKLVHVTQSLAGMSLAHCRVNRSEYIEWGIWGPGDLVQIWAYDVDSSDNYYAHLDFLGEVISNMQGTRKDIIDIVLGAPTHILHNPATTTPAAGIITGILAQLLDQIGGIHWGGMINRWGALRWINRNFLKTGTVNITAARLFKNRKIWEIIRDVAKAENFFVYYTPEGALKITDVWRDKTAILIDTGQDGSFVDYYAWPNDLNQLVNEATVIRGPPGAPVARTTPVPNAASQTAYGIRAGVEAVHVDMQMVDNAEADAVSQTIHDWNDQMHTPIELYFLARYMELRPGDIFKLSCPQLRIGGDYGTAHALWVPETFAVLEKRWDNDGCIVCLRIAKAYVDAAKGLTIGLQDPQIGVRMWANKSRHQADRAQTNQT